jgi:hypothetical protein
MQTGSASFAAFQIKLHSFFEWISDPALTDMCYMDMLTHSSNFHQNLDVSSVTGMSRIDRFGSFCTPQKNQVGDGSKVYVWKYV